MVQLQWIGKDKVINHHHDVPYKVLNKSYTFGDENSWNKIIHWDNLEALKSLLPQYEWKVDCIYIDPPYNTGNEWWVYNDNVNDPRIKKRLHEVVGKEWEDLSRHDKWLCMMYPRLKLLQKLLSDKWAIFISIDDNEQANLKLLCDEIFWCSNFVASIVWKRKRWRDNSARWFSKSHEYIIIYAKYKDSLKIKTLELDEETKKAYKNPDNDSRWVYRMLWTRARGTQWWVKYDFTSKNGQYFPERLWLFSKENLIKLDEDNKLVIRGDKIYRKMFLYENSGKIPETIRDDTSNAANASDEIKRIFWKIIFDTPKPIPYIERIIQISTNKDSIILDSFAWSWTTGHAVLDLNKQDWWNRKFILVELWEYAENITAERVKRVINWYWEWDKKVGWTWWWFDFYELWEPLFVDCETLNENVWEETLRNYIRYSETKEEVQPRDTNNKYFLWKNFDTDYYFYYEKENITELNYDFLAKIKREKNHWLIIYADVCSLSDEFLKKNNIIFKKIPRDISQF